MSSYRSGTNPTTARNLLISTHKRLFPVYSLILLPISPFFVGFLVSFVHILTQSSSEYTHRLHLTLNELQGSTPLPHSPPQSVTFVRSTCAEVLPPTGGECMAVFTQR
jgi:hypothetical protein